ncbi:lamin tail domain-containing protein [Streptomyces sp. NRRL S-475]|uniref:lamin tail domain-containing protein n=1 Tax=Streptomyces sp. NRRL S-475 TaxID=1463910 RepID=UPI000997AE66
MTRHERQEDGVRRGCRGGRTAVARVEITTTGRRAVNLDSWTLRDDDGSTFAFHHYRLGGRSTARVHTGEGRDSRSDLFQDRRTYVWDNRSDTATLRNDRGRFIDDESWGHHRHRHRGDHGHGGRHHR